MKKHRLWIAAFIGIGLLMGVLVCSGVGLIGRNIYLIIDSARERNRQEGSLQLKMSREEEESSGTGSIYTATLKTLENELVPVSDPIDLAMRLEHKADIPRKKPVRDPHRQVGEKETFWVTNVDSSESFQVDTSLAAVTEHAYFWVEEGVKYSQRDLNKLAQSFEEQIYPTNHAFFGSEWSPGVDNDPHLYIIYARGLGSGIAGYFSSVDEYHPRAHEYSNAHESFMLNADNVDFGDPYTYGVLAHEHQHMIHWYRDKNESPWLNEGFSELATLLNDYYQIGGFDAIYAQNPDLQLTDWPNDPSKTTPHYGSSFLFVAYFLDRFGAQATQALVGDDLNGMASVDRVLQDLQIDRTSGDRVMTGDDFFLEWTLTNFLKDRLSSPGYFQYQEYEGPPRFEPTETFESCPVQNQNRDVHQYGVDYIRIGCVGDYQLGFDGQQSVNLLPADPRTGRYAYWSNKGHQSDMKLTREFNFRGVSAPISLHYWTWFDIEEDYDYLYLEASTDGKHWDILKTPSGTDDDPSGNSYGWAYNGESGGDGIWINEEVDLSAYAGQKVFLRFEYITDAAVNGEGFLLDDLSIPAVGYETGFENDKGGWEDEGFVRIQNGLPQTYRLALIHLGDSPEITHLSVSADNRVEVPLRMRKGTDEVILVVTGTTRYTRQKADYSFHISARDGE